MIARRLLLLELVLSAAICLVTSLVLAAEAAAKLQPCQNGYKVYILKKPLHKAVATTGGRSLAAPSTACGFSYGYGTKRLAVSAALRQCKMVQRKNKARGTCQIIESK